MPATQPHTTPPRPALHLDTVQVPRIVLERILHHLDGYPSDSPRTLAVELRAQMSEAQ